MSPASPKLYAPDRSGVVHIVGAHSDLGLEVISICHRRFHFASPPTEKRPCEGGICCHCLHHEQRQTANNPQQESRTT